jgi:deoxycytidine triphosphate deaminase
MSDKWIKKMSIEQDMISPFVDGQKKDGTISYGVSSYGYDARVSEEFKILLTSTQQLSILKISVIKDLLIVQARNVSFHQIHLH